MRRNLNQTWPKGHKCTILPFKTPHHRHSRSPKWQERTMLSLWESKSKQNSSKSASRPNRSSTIFRIEVVTSVWKKEVVVICSVEGNWACLCANSVKYQVNWPSFAITLTRSLKDRSRSTKCTSSLRSRPWWAIVLPRTRAPRHWSRCSKARVALLASVLTTIISVIGGQMRMIILVSARTTSEHDEHFGVDRKKVAQTEALGWGQDKFWVFQQERE